MELRVGAGTMDRFVEHRLEEVEDINIAPLWSPPKLNIGDHIFCALTFSMLWIMSYSYFLPVGDNTKAIKLV